MDLRANAIIQGVDRFSPMMRRIGAVAGMAGRGVGGMVTRSVRGFANVAHQGHLLGAGLGMIGAGGFQAAYGLEHMMNKVQAVGNLTNQQRAELETYSQELNKLYPFTNKEIAGAAFELFRAGFSFEQAKGALKSTLDMALAGDIDRTQAADIATNVLTAMRLPMKTAEQAAESTKRVSDVLAYAATSSNTDIRLLGETFKYVAPLAASAGMTLDEVAASAMTMANNGIKGSEAGIAMRSALVRMAKPTKDMLATLDRLNLNIGDFITGDRDITGDDIVTGLFASGVDATQHKKRIEAMLKDKVMRLKPGQLAANITDLVADEMHGAADRNVIAEAVRDTLTASGKQFKLLDFVEALRDKGVGLAEISRIMDIRQGGRVLTMLLDDLKAKADQIARESGGAARRMADQMQKGTVGALNRMKAAWENFWVSVGKGGAMTDLANSFEGIGAFLQNLSKTNPDLLRFGAHLMAGAAALSAIGFAAMGLGGLFATPLTATISIGGMAGLTMLLSNWEKLEWLFNERHKIDIIFPELPTWLKNAWDMAYNAKETYDRQEAVKKIARQQLWERTVGDFGRSETGKAISEFFTGIWESTPLGAPRSLVPAYSPGGKLDPNFTPTATGGNGSSVPVPVRSPVSFGNAGGVPPPVRNPLVRDIAPSAGPSNVNVDVTGKVDAQLTGSAQVTGEASLSVSVQPSRYFEALVEQMKKVPMKGQLNTGKTMTDTGKN